MLPEIFTVSFAASQLNVNLLILVLASSLVSVIALAAFLFLAFRWLEGGALKVPKVSVCMYCGSRSLSVSPMKDAVGRDTAFCYCNNCKRYFSLDIPPK